MRIAMMLMTASMVNTRFSGPHCPSMVLFQRNSKGVQIFKDTITLAMHLYILVVSKVCLQVSTKAEEQEAPSARSDGLSGHCARLDCMLRGRWRVPECHEADGQVCDQVQRLGREDTQAENQEGDLAQGQAQKCRDSKDQETLTFGSVQASKEKQQKTSFSPWRYLRHQS